MRIPPANVAFSAIAIIPAELPGAARLWLAYRRLDAGAVTHLEYLGMMTGREDETAEEMIGRAEARFGQTGD